MNIFDYTDYSPFISQTLKKRALVLGSMSEVAQSLGYKNSSLLSMIISGKRKPSVDFIHRFSRHFNLSIAEKNDLEAKLWGDDQTQERAKNLRRIYLDPSQCSGLTHWSFLFILNIMAIKGTIPDTKEMVRLIYRDRDRDRDKDKDKESDKNEETIKKVVKDILVLKFLKPDESGRLGPKGIFKISPDCDPLKEDILERQFIQLALEKMRDHKKQDRYVGGEMVNIEESRLEEARKEVSDFLLSFQKKYYHSGSGVMHRLNTQLIRLV